MARCGFKILENLRLLKRVVNDMKRLVLMMCVGVLTIGLFGCGQGAVNDEPEEKEEVEVVITEEDADESQEEQEESDDEVLKDEAQEEQDAVTESEISVYAPNENADAFVESKVKVSAINESEIDRVLTEQNVLSSDVVINSINQTTVDGKETVEADFNQAFSSRLSSMGSSGEYYILGSVVNTLLDAYDCDQVKITIDGSQLELSHGQSSLYYGEFSN